MPGEHTTLAIADSTELLRTGLVVNRMSVNPLFGSVRRSKVESGKGFVTKTCTGGVRPALYDEDGEKMAES